MANFELATLSETHDLIVLIKEILEKATKQKIAYILVDKMKKATGGVATKDAIFNMEEGQSLILTFRTDGDVIKTVLNNKVLPLSRVMDYDDLTEFKAGVEELALKIKGNQAKFDLARQKQRVEVPNDPTLRKKSIKKQTEELNTLLQEANTRIEEKKRTLEAKKNEYQALIGSTEGA